MSRIITGLRALEPFALSKEALLAAEEYPFKTTEYYLSLVRSFSPDDPVFRQIVPSDEEIASIHSSDPFLEEEKMPVPRLIHRYPQRAVFLANNVCASNCRHCMRKRIWKERPSAASLDEMREAADYCRHNGIEDIIISGGDPFLLSPELLGEMIALFRERGNAKILRIGTRLPVVDPGRVSAKLLRILSAAAPLYIMLHYNHPDEWSLQGDGLLRKMGSQGLILMNQSVLLKGVNDDTSVLGKLFMGLLERGVKPYYLHQCDLVRGVTHFWVDLSRGVALLRELQGNISGLALPYLAVDVPGGLGKVLLGPSDRLSKEKGKYRLCTYTGREVLYGIES
jgi:lysine 2,3-aminomutase